ncbi:uncharacterized [Tachysurus ichikawai]
MFLQRIQQNLFTRLVSGAMLFLISFFFFRDVRFASSSPGWESRDGGSFRRGACNFWLSYLHWQMAGWFSGAWRTRCTTLLQGRGTGGPDCGTDGLVHSLL